MKKKCDSPLFNWNEREWDGLNFPPDLPFFPIQIRKNMR